MSTETEKWASPLAPSYAVARARFTSAAEEVGASLRSHPHPEKVGPDGGELAIDVAQLGPVDAPAALLVISGTHGVEGYAGSALQTSWLARLADDPLPDGLRLVMVHAFNPYGFAWHRRTNEDNVDLNRNFIDWEQPPPDNAAYGELAELLVPEEWTDATLQTTTLALLGEAERLGMDEMQRIVSGGQYGHQRGVFFGGTGPVWSHRWLRDHAAELVGAASRVGIIDLHTGLGPRGHGELIIHAGRGEPVYERATSWWGDVRSMSDGESVSAELSGDWLGAIEAMLAGVEVTATALEFGTVDQIQVLQALRGEGWLHGQPHDVVTGPLGDQIRADVRTAFADDSADWLPMLAERFDSVATAAVANLVG